MTLLPIVERELRLRARQPLTHRVRVGVALGVLLLFLLLQWFASGLPPYRVGQLFFEFLGAITLGYCLLAGTFLTADCLSSEKREGTLGLLFLTDLRGWDVVLGKLVATSLQASYALLAMVPAMALPLLLGGVTFGEFWRLVLVLALVLLTSLSVGMLTSALCRESRQSIVVCLGLMIVLAGMPYLVWLALNYARWLSLRSTVGEDLLLLSPVHAYLQSSDGAFRSTVGQAHYWACIKMLCVLGIAPLVVACVLLPRLWRDGQAEQGTYRRISWRRLLGWMRWGGMNRQCWRKRVLEWNPMQWLDGRDRLPAIAQSVIIAVLVSIWLIFWVYLQQSSVRPNSQAAFPICLILAYAIHQVLKGFMAIEATKRLSEDRGSGALELLLVTPLAPASMMQGLVRSMQARFWLPLTIVTLMNLALHWLISWDEPLKLDSDGRFMLGWVICLGGIVMLYVDFFALTWQGMLHGLRRKHHRAVLITLARILLPSWGCFALFVLMAYANTRMTEETVFGMIALWMALGLLNSWVSRVQAREHLRRHFRSMAAGTGTSAEAPTWIQSMLVEHYGQETNTRTRP